MSAILNRDVRRERNEKGEELVKDMECVGCANMYLCKGKPRSTKLCINKKEGKAESGNDIERRRQRENRTTIQ